MAGRIRQVTIREDPYVRLGELVRLTREAMVDDHGKPLSKPQARIRIGFGSRDTLDRIERGLKCQWGSYTQVEKWAGWPLGSIRTYLEQSGPEPHASESDAASTETQIIIPAGDYTDDELQRIQEFARILRETRGRNGGRI